MYVNLIELGWAINSLLFLQTLNHLFKQSHISHKFHTTLLTLPIVTNITLIKL